MTRGASRTGRDGPGEELLDIYKVRSTGNSLAVTVPVEANFGVETTVCMKLGQQDDRIVYLKIIDQSSKENPKKLPVFPYPDVCDEMEVDREIGHEFRQIRGDESEKMVTIPAKYDVDGIFAANSQVAMLAGYTSNNARYLRIVPEDVLTDRLQH